MVTALQPPFARFNIPVFRCSITLTLPAQTWLPPLYLYTYLPGLSTSSLEQLERKAPWWTPDNT